MADHFRDMRVDPVAGADADASSVGDTGEVALLLARFRGPVTLHSSRFKYGLLSAWRSSAAARPAMAAPGRADR